jgi:hypothetical protein
MVPAIRNILGISTWIPRTCSLKRWRTTGER